MSAGDRQDDATEPDRDDLEPVEVIELDEGLEDDDDTELDARELARERRRDRDLSAGERALMRTGLAKGLKQILDAQAARARRDGSSEEGGRRRDEHRR